MENAQFVAIDLETTGKYPLGAEICELAMIRFDLSGQVHERYESLVRPKGGMTQESEKVHGLSLEDLRAAPYIEDLMGDLVAFTKGASLVGHNLPFDLGFLAVDFDRCLKEDWWTMHFPQVNFCTSLLSLQTHPKLKSHRLAHLAEYFELSQAPNHRAMQDAQTCMEVFLKLLEGRVTDLQSLEDLQKDNLLFEQFSIKYLVRKRPEIEGMVKACKGSKVFELMYQKGSHKNKWRQLEPKGLVLKTQNESFLVAVDPGQIQTKRFLLSKIVDTKEIS